MHILDRLNAFEFKNLAKIQMIQFILDNDRKFTFYILLSLIF